MLIVLALLPFSAPQAQQICADRLGILRHLERNHGESPVGAGLTEGGSVVELLTGDNGTWTLIVSNPDGTSCLLATGENWQTAPKKIPLSGKGV